MNNKRGYEFSDDAERAKIAKLDEEEALEQARQEYTSWSNWTPSTNSNITTTTSSTSYPIDDDSVLSDTTIAPAFSTPDEFSSYVDSLLLEAESPPPDNPFEPSQADTDEYLIRRLISQNIDVMQYFEDNNLDFTEQVALLGWKINLESMPSIRELEEKYNSLDHSTWWYIKSIPVTLLVLLDGSYGIMFGDNFMPTPINDWFSEPQNSILNSLNVQEPGAVKSTAEAYWVYRRSRPLLGRGFRNSMHNQRWAVLEMYVRYTEPRSKSEILGPLNARYPEIEETLKFQPLRDLNANPTLGTKIVLSKLEGNDNLQPVQKYSIGIDQRPDEFHPDNTTPKKELNLPPDFFDDDFDLQSYVEQLTPP